MNLERQIKHHLLARPQTARFSPGPGCGEALETELRALLADLKTPQSGQADPGAVRTVRDGILVERIRYRSLLELVMRVSTAQDVFLGIAEAPAHNREGLSGLLRTVHWRFYFRDGDEALLRIESEASTLYHKGLIRELISRELAARGINVVRPSVGAADTATPLRLNVRILHNLCRIEISLAGYPLWHRGYRASFHTVAPLREDIAQSAIRLSLFDAEADAILVPFAGSGTLLFEYLIASHRIPPFVFGRGYAFERFPAETPPSVGWMRQRHLEELASRISSAGHLAVRLIDRSEPAVESGRHNWERFGSLLAAARLPAIPLDLGFVCADVFSRPWREWLPAETEKVFLPLNPPYGLRLANVSTDRLYRRIGRACTGFAESLGAQHLSGFILCPTESSWRAFLGSSSRLTSTTSHFSQGGLDIRLCRFRS